MSKRWDNICSMADQDAASLYASLLWKFAQQSRPDLLKIIEITHPIAFRIGGTETIQEITQAIMDVGCWWP